MSLFVIDLLTRVLCLLLFTIRFVYWTITEYQAHKEKPLSKSPGLSELLKRLVTMGGSAIVVLQLVGLLSILPFSNTAYIQIIGFLLVFVSFVIGISARKTIGSNWAHAADYQIKKDHQLVTDGIYKYIRHPIYTGFMVSLLGAELVEGSYVFFILLVVLPIMAYLQARREEVILTKKFGEKYKHYMKQTKMFFPYIW